MELAFTQSLQQFDESHLEHGKMGVFFSSEGQAQPKRIQKKFSPKVTIYIIVNSFLGIFKNLDKQSP